MAIYATAWLTFIGFLRVSGTAALLYFPYLMWLTYAGAIQLWMVMYSSSQVADEQRKKHVDGVVNSKAVPENPYGARTYNPGGVGGDITVSKRTTVTAESAEVAPKNQF